MSRPLAAAAGLFAVALLVAWAAPLAPAGVRPPVAVTMVRPSPSHTEPGPAQAVASPVGLPSWPARWVWVSWRKVELDSGSTLDGGLPGTSSTESAIKVGVAAMFLRQLGRSPTPAERGLVEAAIARSDDPAAQQLYLRAGGTASIGRLVSICGLQRVVVVAGWWSKTQMDPIALIDYLLCVAQGRVVPAVQAAWLLELMRSNPPEQRFGIAQARPSDGGVPVAVKNGWTWREDGLWHVNCLGLGARWALAVMTRYPGSWGLEYGAGLCRQIAAAVLPA